MSFLQTAERVSDMDLSDNYVYQRSLLAYYKAAEIVSGRVLEIGTGSGYGIKLISSKAEQFTTIDKFENPALINSLHQFPNVSFVKMNIPPLSDIPDNSFDYVITFQVIEHIQDDTGFIKEIHRVLKSGGKLILTTPNKKMSITRNPWHIREYTIQELETVLKKQFAHVDTSGVFGNEKIMEYYRKNKESVAKLTRFDIFNLQYRLPRQLLQIPYDIMNRLNRKKLLKNNSSLVSDIKMEDYIIKPADDNCFDLFYVATKA